MFYVEDDNFLSDKQKSYLEESLNSEKMSFKLGTSTVEPDDKGYHFINHILLSKDRPRKYHTHNQEEINHFVDILKTFCDKNNVPLNNIFRIGVNVTFNNGFISKCPPHIDHDYDHKQVILYLNDAVGDTVILDDNKKPLKISIPKKYKAICFDKRWHYHYFPQYGIRIVVVFTFD